MSAETTLRRAAVLMRERAEEPVAQPERWPNFVALPLADWLDETALRWEYVEERELALAVANAYLQETP